MEMNVRIIFCVASTTSPSEKEILHINSFSLLANSMLPEHNLLV